jgi:hypothetical protein
MLRPMTFRWVVQLVAQVRGMALLGLGVVTLSGSAAAQQPAAGDPSMAGASLKQASGRTLPEISLRVDPFNWILEGRLGMELEVAVGHGLSVELVPILVTSASPPTLNLEGRDDNLLQSSNGLGPLSGTSVGVGWWLDGTPFRGYVLRGILTNYGYTFRSTDSAGNTIDRVNRVERELVAFFGGYSRWGAFTLGGGIGLGIALSRERRCFDSIGGLSSVALATSDCQDDEQLIALDPGAERVVNLAGSLAPAVLQGRFSLGVAF